MELSEIKRITDECEAIAKKLTTIIDSRKAEIDNIRTTAEEFYQVQYVKTLSALSVDTLSVEKNGIRVAYLKDAGITNMYQLSLMNYSQIRAVEGIGTQNAKKINNLKHEIVDNLKKNIPLRISVDNPSDAALKVVKSICIFLCHDEIREDAKKLLKPLEKLLASFEDKSAIDSKVGWFFTSKYDKSEIESKIIEFYKYLKSNKESLNALFKNFNDIKNSNDSAYMMHFSKYSSFYYSTMEKYCKKITATNKIKSSLSAEFVKEINSQYVNLNKFKATLRPYQLFGVKYMLHQKKTLLGDEMGLGKTVQAIAAMVALKAAKKKHFLVVCPASVLINWIKEIKKFSDIPAIKIHGGDADALNEWMTLGGIAVTTYDSLTRLKFPRSFKIDMLVVDEAHYVKNPDAQRTKAVTQLVKQSDFSVYMTGTPLINSVEEMCFLVECLQPQIAKSLDLVKIVSSAEDFRYELSPVYLRRHSEDVAKELPEIIRKDQWCDLNAVEADRYIETLRSRNYMDIRRVSWNVDDLKTSSKAERLIEICENAKEQGRKVIVFSYFLDTIEKVCRCLKDCQVFTLTGNINAAKRPEIIDKFSAAPAGSVLVSQLVTGGTGLNIQAASVVIFCEPTLTPASEEQAIKRAHRIGQTRDVVVYRLIADDTVDERVLEILASKQEKFEAFAENSVVADKQQEMETENSVIAEAINLELKRLNIS